VASGVEMIERRRRVEVSQSSSSRGLSHGSLEAGWLAGFPSIFDVANSSNDGDADDSDDRLMTAEHAAWLVALRARGTQASSTGPAFDAASALNSNPVAVTCRYYLVPTISVNSTG